MPLLPGRCSSSRGGQPNFNSRQTSEKRESNIDAAQNTWDADKNFFNVLQPHAPLLLQRTFCVCFDSVTVDATEGLHSLTVQLYLDDTTNGVEGLGNTRFISLEKDPSSSSNNCTRKATNVYWPMMGAVQRSSKDYTGGGSCTTTFRGHPKDDFRGVTTTLRMPDTVKIVVTGTVQVPKKQSLEKEQGEDVVHGLMGGTTVALSDFFEGLRDTGKYTVNIRNSFIPPGTKIDERGFQLQPLQVVFSAEGEGSSKSDLLKAAAVRLFGLSASQTRSATASHFTGSAMHRAFTENAMLFKPSELPHKSETQLITKMLGPMVNKTWCERIQQKVYPLPSNAPSNFADLSMEDKNTILNKEAGMGQFRGMQTPNARNDCHGYVHSVAALPAMHDEREQTAITNKEMLFHSFHAALTVFEPYGWTLQTIFKKVGEQQFDDGELVSFLGCVLCVGHTMPSTQEYVSDDWLLRVPDLNGNSLKYMIMGGEDWNHCNGQHSKFDYKKSTGSVSGADDCESKADYVLSTMLAFVEIAGGKGSHLIASSGMDQVVQRTWEEVMPTDLREKGTDSARDRSSSFHCSVNEKSLIQFCRDVDAEMTICQNGTRQDGSSVLWIRRTAQAIAVLAALYASDSCRAHLTLGGAYGAANVTDQKKERKVGGHGYGTLEIFGCSQLMEATAALLITSEHAQHVESVTKVGGTLADMLNQRIHRDVFAKMHTPARTLMTASPYEHTEQFYGKAVILSEALPMQLASEKGCYRGCYLFTKDEKIAGQLLLGANPENICVESTVRGEIRGTMLDKMMADTKMLQQYRSNLMTLGSTRSAPMMMMTPTNNNFCTHPLTTFVDASVAGVRELCGARCSHAQLAEWMKRMYCAPHPLSVEEHTDTFASPGRVVHVVATFRSGKEATEHCAHLKEEWERLMKSEGGMEELLGAVRKHAEQLQQTIRTQCLSNNPMMQHKLAAAVHTVHALEGILGGLSAAGKVAAAAAKAAAKAAAAYAKKKALELAAYAKRKASELKAYTAKKLKERREREQERKQAKEDAKAEEAQKLLEKKEEEEAEALRRESMEADQEALQARHHWALMCDEEAAADKVVSGCCCLGGVGVECGGQTTLNVVHLWARFEHPLPATVYTRDAGHSF